MGARPLAKLPRCSNGGKVGYRTRTEAHSRARIFARNLLREGRLVSPIFSYRCPACGLFHLTRDNRITNRLAFMPADEATQLWAMTPGQREALEEERRARREREGMREAARDLLRLPDPAPIPEREGRTKQPYANRPKGLRYR